LSLQDTFGRAKTWVKELQRQASPNIVIALVDKKADLANKKWWNMMKLKVMLMKMSSSWRPLQDSYECQ
jgi:hypothetical protein